MAKKKGPPAPTSGRWRRCATLLLALISLPLATSAQPQQAPHKPQWRASAPSTPLERGLVALKLGDHRRAIKELREALKASPSPEVWLNLGLAYSHLNQVQQSAQAYRRFLHRADPVRDAGNLRTVAAELDRLRRTSTVLVLAVTPAPTRITVDDQAVTTDDNSIWLAPGAHRLGLSAPQHEEHLQAVELPAGQFRFALLLRPAQRSQATRPTPPAPTTAPPDTSAAPTPSRPTAPKPEVESTPNQEGPACLLGATCIGLVATGGLPNALGIGVSLRIGDYLGIGFDAQFLPELTVDSAEVKAKLFIASVRLHPMKNALFASVGLGLQQVRASLDHPAASVHANWNIPVLGLGFGLVSRSGFTLGIDLAVFIELQNSDLKLEAVDFGTEFALEPALQARLESEANSAVDSVRSVLPVMFQLNVLRVGYQF